jgi:hypothetical protein
MLTKGVGPNILDTVSQSFKHLHRRRAMRLARSFILIAGFFVFFGGTLFFMDAGGSSKAQSQLGQPAMWGDDVVVHAGKISRYPRNGYSADYFDGFPTIYADVACYSSGPDTCRFYTSGDGGENWLETWPYFYVSETGADVSNPQTVVGEGTNSYVLHFILDQNLGEIILVRRFGSILDTVTISDGNESFAAIRDDPGSNYYLYLARAKNTKETIFMYSSNFGENWQSKDTVDGDMPNLTTAGISAEDVYLAWRLDGEKGALYGAYDSIASGQYAFVRKNLGPGVGGWKYYLAIDPQTHWCDARCLLQGSDGTIYFGIDTASSSDDRAAVWKSQDGGETWTLTDDLGDAIRIDDLLEGSDGAIYAALTDLGGPFSDPRPRVYKTTNGGEDWSNTGTIGGLNDDRADCLAGSTDGTIYVGTSGQGDVFKNTDGGSNWDECGDLAGAEGIIALLVTHTGSIIAGDCLGDSAGFYRSTNAGVSWTLVKPVNAPTCVTHLFQASDGTILAGGHNPAKSSNGVMKSTNDGVSWTWTSFSTSGDVNSIVETSDSYLYLSEGYHVYRSINHGDTWTLMSGSPGVVDLMASRPQIAVKKSTNRGVTWGRAEKLSTTLYDKSDPKIAGPHYAGTIAVWVAYSEKNVSGDWNLRYAYSSGSTWSKGHSLAGGSGSDKQLCDLRCARGSPTVHAAYCSDETGSRKLYYRYATTSNPTSWSDTLRISGTVPTTYHTPEISFYGYNPVVFFCGQTISLPPQYPNNLYVDAQHFTGVEEEEEELTRPDDFSLCQNYPNPFNPTTSIRYTVHGKQTPLRTTLKIYNIRGQLVRTLVDEPKGAGTHQAIWDGRSDDGKDVASGIYLCQLRIGDFSQTKKMVLMK